MSSLSRTPLRHVPPSTYSLCCSQDAAPKGRLEIPAGSHIVPSADRPHCWRVSTTEVPTGLAMHAADAESKRRWIDAIRGVINAQATHEGTFSTASAERVSSNMVRQSGLTGADLA